MLGAGAISLFKALNFFVPSLFSPIPPPPNPPAETSSMPGKQVVLDTALKRSTFRGLLPSHSVPLPLFGFVSYAPSSAGGLNSLLQGGSFILALPNIFFSPLVSHFPVPFPSPA